LVKTNTDFIGVDVEHSATSFEQIQNIIISAQSSNVPCLPRIATHDNESIKRILDLGADGIIVPNVDTVDQINQIVKWMKYPPLGRRGYGIARAQGYGHNFDKYINNWNKKSILVIQIESIEAVNNIESLVSHNEVDGVMIGPYDISGSLGVPGKLFDPKVKKSCLKVLNACKKYKKSCGIQDSNPSDKSIKGFLKEGYSFIILSSDIFTLWKWTENINVILNKLKK
jgi:2-keto-3-deoxy-L-rhamnonate aldolase RhmA